MQVYCLATNFFRYPATTPNPMPSLQLLQMGSLDPHQVIFDNPSLLGDTSPLTTAPSCSVLNQSIDELKALVKELFSEPSSE